MKFAIFSFLCLLSLAASCALYGWLESTVNMMEGFGQLFAPGATTVIFSPFLLLFIMLGLLVFVAAPMFFVGLGAALGGLLLRSRVADVSRFFIWAFVIVAVVCHIVFLLLATQQNASYLLERPRIHPKPPAYVLAGIAGANAALDLFVAALIIRRLIAKANMNSFSRR